jgi:hypothetical protein
LELSKVDLFDLNGLLEAEARIKRLIDRPIQELKENEKDNVTFLTSVAYRGLANEDVDDAGFEQDVANRRLEIKF